MGFPALFDTGTRHLSLRGGLDWQFKRNDAILDARAKRFHTSRGVGRIQNVSRLKANFPGM